MDGRGACVAGGHAWQGGVHGGGGHAWQGGMHGFGACMAGGYVWQGGCAWQGEVCMPQQILQDTVNERAVRILLECILVTVGVDIMSILPFLPTL